MKLGVKNFPGGRKVPHSLASIPTLVLNRHEKAACVWDKRLDILEQWIEKQGSAEVPNSITGRFT